MHHVGDLGGDEYGLSIGAHQDALGLLADLDGAHALDLDAVVIVLAFLVLVFFPTLLLLLVVVVIVVVAATPR